jgi:hypothetical protein
MGTRLSTPTSKSWPRRDVISDRHAVTCRRQVQAGRPAQVAVAAENEDLHANSHVSVSPRGDPDSGGFA